ncbi:N-6 DNA methylase [Candidatus Gracilibacteria bacterium]|nr:N-6 DNA methylase [Candidatus Gracilibacteria bacterium]MCF7898706.1 N-6 DNA methylase [Candidatus Paceibacterota bacterium]
MNAETKRHIDAARQVLVGVVPNPASQIDQITNALIYKFMDDMDQSAIKQGGEPSFFTGDLKDYAWTRLMDTRIGNQERMNIYSEALVKFSESKQLPQLFREIFKSAFLPYRSPEVLGLFLKEIDYFDYSHPEELGNAYEYLLSIMSSQGDAGQFRTPRHIIDFIVNIINPTAEDKVLDPACGTGGFLVSAYKHIAEQHDGKNSDGSKNKEKPLTPDQRKNLMSNFEGYDIDPGMVRIAQVNMYLHQFKNPKIYNYDSLSMDERWNDKFDVILANPPFMSPKGGVSTHNKFSINATRSEVLFVDYIMNHLKPKGKAGIIVPEGIIFQSGTSHKQLRKNLVNDGLYAVVSLPAGVFQPYSGVKTSILLFNNELAKQSKEILFVKVENDGFGLGAQRRTSTKNDLPEVLEILNKWNSNKKVENVNVLYVEKTKIAETDDYNLSGDRYRTAIDYSNVKWSMVSLGDVCDLHRGVVYSKSDEVLSDGYGILRANNISLDSGLILDDVKLISKNLKLKEVQKFKAGDIFICLASGSKDHIGKVAYIKEDTDFYFGGFMGAVRIKNGTIDSRFLFSLLKDQKFNDFLRQEISGANINNLNSGILSRYKIPLPPLDVQEKIVAEIDSYQNIITGAKQITNNWKPLIDIDPTWEKVKLGTVCGYAGGTQPPKSTFVDNPKEGYVRLLQIRDYKSDKNATYISTSVRHKTCNENDIMIGRYGPPVFQILRGKAGAYNVALMKCLPDNSKITNDWLYYFLVSDSVQEKIISLSGRVRQSGVNPADLDELVIPLPVLEIQKQIVERVKVEHSLVEGNNKLVEIYEQKIRETLAKLWEQ